MQTKYGRVFTEGDVRKMLESQSLNAEQAQALIEGFDKAGVLTFPADEPLFLLRGKDKATVMTISSYADRCTALGSPAAHVQAVTAYGGEILGWQAANFHSVRAAD